MSNSNRTMETAKSCSPKSPESNYSQPRPRRKVTEKPKTQEELRDAIVQFDSKIFLSIWRDLFKDQPNTEQQLETPKFDDLPIDWKSELVDEPVPSADDLKEAPSANFDRHDCALLTIDGTVVRANRELLMQSSKLLHLEFQANPSKKVVPLPIQFDALIVVVGAIYQRETGDIQSITKMLEKVEISNLFEIFEASVRMSISFFTDLVGEHLFERATPSIYVVTYCHLKVHCPQIAERLWAKIVGEFHKVALSKTHKLLNAQEIKRMIFDERINIARGDEIEIVRQWARFNRYENQPHEFQAIRRQLNDTLLGSMGRNTQRHLPYSVIFALGGWGANGPTNKLEVLNGYTENWIEPRFPFGDLPSPRCYYSAVPMPEVQSVYVMGGFDGTRYYDGSTRFKLDTMSWDESSFAPLNERRCYINASRLDSTHILACGGYNNTNRMTSAELMDVGRNQWIPIAPMNTVRSDGYALEMNGKVYVVGGFDGTTCHRSVESYDPIVNQWTPLQKEMREKRSGVSAISIHGALFAIGGFTGRTRLSSAEFYDPREGRWHSIPNMILKRSNFGVSELRSDPICAGGYDGSGTTELCEKFDWRAMKWTSIPSMRFRRSALSLFRLDNLSNVDRFFTR